MLYLPKIDEKLNSFDYFFFWKKDLYKGAVFLRIIFSAKFLIIRTNNFAEDSKSKFRTVFARKS